MFSSNKSLAIILTLVGLAAAVTNKDKYPAYNHEWSSMFDPSGVENSEWVRIHDDEFDSVRTNPRQQTNQLDEPLRILYSDVPMPSLVYRCFQNIPLRYRKRCLFDAFERFAGSVFASKTRCCTKWAQIKCLEEYAFNSLYCNLHERVAVSRHFKKVQSLEADGSPECHDYRPVEEERQLWGSEAGRVPKCALGTKQELKH